MNPYSILAVLLAAAILAFFWFKKASMTQGLALANFVVFVLTLLTGNRYGIGGSVLLEDLAFKPIYFAQADLLQTHTIVTAAFLHASFAHIVGNMLVLLLVGMPFEERMGRARFLGVYFMGSIVAIVLHVLWIFYTGDAMDVPVVGASGAVFGILGGFAATYPRDQIPMFLVFILLPRVPVIIAAIILSLFEAVALFGGAATGVAHAAHIGGAIGGAIAAPLLKPRFTSPSQAGSARNIQYEVLDRLAQDERTRHLVQRVRENSDTAELQRAWLDRLFVRLRCPQCSEGYSEVSPGVLECDRGHRERYAQ